MRGMISIGVLDVQPGSRTASFLFRDSTWQLTTDSPLYIRLRSESLLLFSSIPAFTSVLDGFTAVSCSLFGFPHSGPSVVARLLTERKSFYPLKCPLSIQSTRPKRK